MTALATQKRASQWLQIKGAAQNDNDTAMITLVQVLGNDARSLSLDTQQLFDDWLRASIADLQASGSGAGTADFTRLQQAIIGYRGNPIAIPLQSAKYTRDWLQLSLDALTNLTETVLYRVSCGDAVAVNSNDGDISWEADGATPSPYVSGTTNRSGNALTWAFDASVPDFMQINALYFDERFSANMDWTFDLTGYTQARVYVGVGESFFTSAGNRVFSATVNGQSLFSNLDLFSVYGRGTSAVYSALVTPNASDNVVINFTPSVDNAIVNAIQVNGLV